LIADRANAGLAAYLDARLTVRAAVILFWSALVVFLAIAAFLPKSVSGSGWLALAEKITVNLLVALWVLADGRAHKLEAERLQWYAIFSALLTEIALPIYLVKTRGWKGAGKTSLRFIRYLAVILAVTFVCFAIVAGVLDFFGIPHQLRSA
jgi:hypothetical protein